jgi:hypothetical protein
MELKLKDRVLHRFPRNVDRTELSKVFSKASGLAKRRNKFHTISLKPLAFTKEKESS